ncbi:MAG: hypothetical protein QUT27_06265, partial [candidate division Zixibacteria bacterium]|nr:hypothetical protein [candidate division Zixibacteria bacterium]
MQATDAAGAIDYEISISDCAAQGDTETGSDLSFVPAAPAISGISLTNTTTGLTCVKTGDVVRLDFTTTDTGTSPGVLVAGHAITGADLTGGPTSWSAVYTMQATDAAGAIDYEISISDCAAQGDTEIGSALNFIKTPPAISVGTFTSNNANNTCAMIGDEITLSFITDDTGTTPTVTIAGNSVTPTGGPTSWSAAYTMKSSDTEGAITYSASIADCTGTIGSMSGGGVTFYKTTPGITFGMFSSNNTNNSCAKVGDAVTLTFTTDDTGTTPTVTIAGNSVTPTGGPTSWSASYTMQVSDTAGALSYDASIQDCAGNNGSISGGGVTFYKTNPAVTLGTFTSNNANNTCAKIGDVVTLTFMTDDTGETPTVTIAGNSITPTGGPTSWSASYTMQATDAAGAVNYSASIEDCAGNTGSISGGGVTFCATNPT